MVAPDWDEGCFHATPACAPLWLVACALGMALASAAGAATLQTSAFSRPQLAAAQDAMADFLATHTVNNFHAETFGGY